MTSTWQVGEIGLMFRRWLSFIFAVLVFWRQCWTLQGIKCFRKGKKSSRSRGENGLRSFRQQGQLISYYYLWKNWKKKGKWLSFFFFAGKNGAFSKESLLLVNTPFSFNRAADVIDALKSRVPDPCVTCQWGVVGSETNTLATLHVTSPDVGDMGRLVCILF